MQNYDKNEAVQQFLSEFRISQGPLYHYTNRTAGEAIASGHIWITRADCFLDDDEIQHGFDIIRSAGPSNQNADFAGMLAALRERLKACYIMSLTQDAENQHLKSQYSSGQTGCIVEFDESFPRATYSGWHYTPKGDGWRTHPFYKLYDHFEGFMVYKDSRKEQLADIAYECFSQAFSTSSHIVDTYQYVDALLRCLILFKKEEPDFVAEKEYRLAVVSKHELGSEFEHTRDGKYGEIVYIKTFILKGRFKSFSIRNL